MKPKFIALYSVLFMGFIASICVGQDVLFKELQYVRDVNKSAYTQNTMTVTTNNIVETVIGSYLIPANTISSNAMYRYTLIVSTTTPTANNKCLLLKIGGTLIRGLAISGATQQTFMYEGTLLCQNNPKAQIGFPSVQQRSYGGFGSAANALTTYAVDFTITNTMFLSCSNAISTDNFNLEALKIEQIKYLY